MDAAFDRLTRRQREVYDFVEDKILNRGYGPTVREIGEQFGISSPNGVMCHLKALEKKGLIRRSPNKSRAIELTREINRSFADGGPIGGKSNTNHGDSGSDSLLERGLPMAGRVAAGVLHEAVEQDRRFHFDEVFAREGCFMLEVHGDSMIEAHIADGDYAIVDPNRSVSTGSMVVAVTEDGEATLKYWFPEQGRIRLQPANSAMSPIYVNRAEVRGVVVGVVRKLS